MSQDVENTPLGNHWMPPSCCTLRQDAMMVRYVRCFRLKRVCPTHKTFKRTLIYQDINTQLIYQDTNTQLIYQDTNTQLIYQDTNTQLIYQDTNTQLIYQDTNTQLNYQDTNTQSTNYRGSHLCQATKRHLNGEKDEKLNEKRNNLKFCCCKICISLLHQTKTMGRKRLCF